VHVCVWGGGTVETVHRTKERVLAPQGTKSRTGMGSQVHWFQSLITFLEFSTGNGQWEDSPGSSANNAVCKSQE
jgi:hypothetical protein